MGPRNRVKREGSTTVSWLKGFVVVCGLILASLTVADRVHACSCMRQEPAEAVEDSASVFEGRVSAVVEEERGFRVTLSVVRTWKGADAETVEVRTAGSSAACGFPFEEGKSYLVYARLAEEDGVQPVSLCSRTGLIENAHEDLAFLGAGVTPVNPTVGPGSQPAVGPTDQAGGQQSNPARGGSGSDPHRAAVTPGSGGCQSCAASISAADRLADLGGGAVIGLATLMFLRRRFG